MMLLQNLDSPLLDEAAVRLVASAEPLPNELSHHLAWFQTTDGVYLYRRYHAPDRVRSEPPGGLVKLLGTSYNTLSVETTGVQKLVIADAYYPGWLAFANQRPVAVEPHGVFRELHLDGTPQRVWMVYYPASVVAGIFCGLLSLMALVAIAVAGGRRRE